MSTLVLNDAATIQSSGATSESTTITSATARNTRNPVRGFIGRPPYVGR